MPKLPGFIGGSATVRSRNANAERSINWYPEQVPGTGKVSAYLPPTPGLAPFTVLTAGPVRALFAQNGRAFAVGGAVFYEVLASGNALIRGAVAVDGRPATISSSGTNGNQLFITSGGLGYIYDLTADTLVQITADGFPLPVAMGAFSDGYFLALKAGSNQFNVSALLDGLSWDSLDVAQVSTVSDHVVALKESHRDIDLFGSQTSSVWTNIGDGDFPYAPQPGVKIDQGCAAAFSVVGLDNSLFWLGQSEHGDRVVWKLNGYTPERISTHAVEYALAQAERLDDAIGYGYQEDGHTFYVLYVPDLANHRTWGTTWVYDVATGLWHERALWDSTLMDWQPHLSRCHAFGFGKHLVGDRLSPAIYVMRMGLATDGQVVIGDGPAFGQPVVEYASEALEAESELAYGEDVTAGSLLVAMGSFYAWDTTRPEIEDSQGNTWRIRVYDGYTDDPETAGQFSATAIAGSSGPCTVTITPNAPSYFSFCLREVLNAGTLATADTRHSDTAVGSFAAGLTAAQPAGTLVLGGWTTGAGPSPEPVVSAPFTQDVEIDLTNVDFQAFSGTYYRVPTRRVADPTWTITPDSTGMAQALAVQPGRLTPVPTGPVVVVDPPTIPPPPDPPEDPEDPEDPEEPAPDPPEGMLSPAGMTFKGYRRFPFSNWNMFYGAHMLALREYGGQLRVFTDTLDGSPPAKKFLEYIITDDEPSLSIASAPYLTYVADHGNVWRNAYANGGVLEGDVANSVIAYGAAWDAVREGFWLTHGDPYGVSPNHYPTLSFVKFSGGTVGSVYGPWRTTALPNMTGGPLLSIPPSFQPYLSGMRFGIVPASGSGIATRAAGCSIAGFEDINPLTLAAATLPNPVYDPSNGQVGVHWALQHDGDHPQTRDTRYKVCSWWRVGDAGSQHYNCTLNNHIDVGTPLWGGRGNAANLIIEDDGATGATFIETATQRAVLFAVQLATTPLGHTAPGDPDGLAHFWYGDPFHASNNGTTGAGYVDGRCCHGQPDPWWGATGGAGYYRVPHWMLYDPIDLQASASGAAPLWSRTPTTVHQLTDGSGNLAFPDAPSNHLSSGFFRAPTFHAGSRRVFAVVWGMDGTSVYGTGARQPVLAEWEVDA